MDPINVAEHNRLEELPNISLENKSSLGQFMTPAVIAKFMSEFFIDLNSPANISLLDPGAGLGSLSACAINRVCELAKNTQKISVTAYEVDPQLTPFLKNTFEAAIQSANLKNVELSTEVRPTDFIDEATSQLSEDLFSSKEVKKFTHAIINPPYKKIKSNSKHRKQLRKVGIETSNLYTAFLSLAIELLEPGGELVAITPRSFCNGSYFLPFRKFFNQRMTLKRIHVFHKRSNAFKDDNVLQENIIFSAIKEGEKTQIKLTSSTGAEFDDLTEREVEYGKVLNPEDPNHLIHIAVDSLDDHVNERMRAFECSYKDLGISISTGPVVDFRLEEFIHQEHNQKLSPLIYSTHFNSGSIRWPKENSKKPNAIEDVKETEKWLMPNGYYTLTKRFSAKEEKRRIVAAVFDPSNIEAETIGFENHLNVYHSDKNGLNEDIAKGLAVWLNSSLVDLYFRQFNGNTQVNASDLRILPYPNQQFLLTLGRKLKNVTEIPQEEIDKIIEDELCSMGLVHTTDPIKAKARIKEMAEILTNLDCPIGLLNDVLVCIVLAIIGLKPKEKWHSSKSTPLMISELAEFVQINYGKDYTIETYNNFIQKIFSQLIASKIICDIPISSSKKDFILRIDPQTLKAIQESDQ